MLINKQNLCGLSGLWFIFLYPPRQLASIGQHFLLLLDVLVTENASAAAARSPVSVSGGSPSL